MNDVHYEPGISLKNRRAIFVHIQKTAGTSIVDSLRHHYREEHVISHGDFLRAVPYLTTDAKIDAEFVANLHNVRFLSGHFGYNFAKPFMNERYSFTFLRNPVERVLSFYYFCRTRDPNEYEIYRLCHEFTLDEFLSKTMEQPEINSLIWNNQAWQLACGFGNDENLAPSSFEPEKLLDLAIRHLDDFSYIGFTETFDHDRDRILLHLGVSSHPEKFISNSTSARPVATELPRSTLALLGQVTELDQVLYSEAWARRTKKTIKPRKPMNERPHIPLQLNISVPLTQMTSPDLSPDKLQQVQNSYLELMQSCLTGSIYRDTPRAPFGPTTFNPYLREHGLDWPAHAQTMIGAKRLANLRALTESVIADNVPGDFIETGVWRGGACILMRAVLYAHNVTERCVWAADSFEGLPSANELQYPADAGSEFHKYEELAVTLEQVQNNFRAYGLLDEQTKFLKGWFKDTLPGAPIEQLALMRLDGDMYESTMDSLTSLYPRLSPGGYVIIDDYHVVPACKAAVTDYCLVNGLHPEIVEIDGVGVYWRKPGLNNQLKDKPAEPNRRIESTEGQVGRLHRAISELSLNVITQLERCLAARDEHIQVLNQALAELNHTIDEQSHVIEQRNQGIAERDGRIVDYNMELSELKEQIEALRSSTSWRITAPMRGVKGILSTFGSKSPTGADTGIASGTAFDSDNYATVAETAEYSPNRAANEAMSSKAVSELTKHTANTTRIQTRQRVNTPPVAIWKDDFHLKVDEVNFHLVWDSEELRNGVSTADDFLLGKNRSMVEKLIEMEQQQQRISKIFEMGIFKGGSVALHDRIFRPLKIAAIEYRPEPVPALSQYISRYSKHNSVKPYYGVSQADRPAMEKILSLEFPKRDINLIVDDASHLYEETRHAFNISFPFLAPGGIYIIEDWGWAHWAGDTWQGETSYFYGRTALSNLIIELFMLAASRPDFITDIHIAHSTITITKGSGAVPAAFDIADYYLLRGKHFSPCL